jgi:hypothetical protein
MRLLPLAGSESGVRGRETRTGELREQSHHASPHSSSSSSSDSTSTACPRNLDRGAEGSRATPRQPHPSPSSSCGRRDFLPGDSIAFGFVVEPASEEREEIVHLCFKALFLVGNFYRVSQQAQRVPHLACLSSIFVFVWSWHILRTGSESGV